MLGGKRTQPVGHLLTSTALVVARPDQVLNDNAVQEARRNRVTKIVKFDWLEDSLLSKSERPLKEETYLFEKVALGKRKRPPGKRTTTEDTADGATEPAPKKKFGSKGRDRTRWSVESQSPPPPRPKKQATLKDFGTSHDLHVCGAYSLTFGGVLSHSERIRERLH